MTNFNHIPGEVLGKFPGGVATGAVQEAIEDKNLGQYQYEL